jgi:hypothetical protein
VAWLAFAASVAALIWFNPAGGRRHADGGGSSTVTVIRDAGQPERQLSDAAVPNVPTAPSVPDVEEPSNDAPLYTITDALEDVASGPLELIGTGPWFGNYSIHACAYRNERVVVVNVYCTRKEQPAFGLAVFSPERGRVYLYAEADDPISTLQRTDYGTFRAEVQPLPEDAPLSLDLSYTELNAWEERRYKAHEGACWQDSGQSSCSHDLMHLLDEWAASAKPWIADPPASWYQLTKDLHARAARDLKKK